MIFFPLLSANFFSILFSDADHFLKVFIDSATTLLLFYALGFLARRPVDLCSDQGTTPAALGREVLTTGIIRKALII